MTTAEQILDMVANGQSQKARFWYKNIKKRHDPKHVKKLDDEIRRLKNERQENHHH